MPRTERAPGWGKRFERVRLRLKRSRSYVARACGYKYPSPVRDWEKKDASPGVYTLKRGLKALGVPDVDRTLSWLADGEGPEPFWLNGVPGSPLPPSGPDGLVAMPQRALDVAREAFRVLDRARADGSLRDPTALKVWNVLEAESAFAAGISEPAAQGSRWTSNAA